MAEGIDETMSLDHCTHSLFGASKVAADVLTQEYGRYFGLRTGTFRGGCLTGPHHAGRRAARVPQLPRAHRAARRAVHDLRLQGEAGPRPDPLGRRDQRVLGLRPGPAARRGLQPRRRQGQRRQPPRVRRAGRRRRPAASARCSPTTSRPGSATTSATTPTWPSSGRTSPAGARSTTCPAIVEEMVAARGARQLG